MDIDSLKQLQAQLDALGKGKSGGKGKKGSPGGGKGGTGKGPYMP